jgi:hypothetical protein
MRKLTRLLVPTLCVLALATGARAEADVPAAGTQDVPSQAAAMRRLDFMVGLWAGSGWNLGQTGARQSFVQTEIIRYQAGGLAISVEGEGRDPADLSHVVASALAVINFNDVTNQYRWEVFTAGFVSVATPVVGDDSFQWSLVTGGPTIRYSIAFTRTSWHEVGEVSTDGGASWHQTFQMDLRRIH